MDLKLTLPISSKALRTTNPSEPSPLPWPPSSSRRSCRKASNRSMLLFGHGDGGGGPAISHLEKLRRLVPCESVARIHMSSTPDDFFKEVPLPLSLPSRISSFLCDADWTAGTERFPGNFPEYSRSSLSCVERRAVPRAASRNIYFASQDQSTEPNL
jgi:hypothetical protein